MNDECKLADKTCQPCKGGVEPLNAEQIKPLYNQLPEGWEVVDEKKLTKTFKFKNFKQALDYTIKVGHIAEQQNHHPSIFLTWGKVKLTVYTHKINGLHESDFIFAAKADSAY